MAVPLSYSLPAFRPDGWDRAADQLAALRDLGFRWVTLHPTYAVSNETQQIRTDNVPPVEPVLLAARGLGLKVRLEPHLDYESTLRPTSPEYIWRNEMRIDPAGEYFDRVLRPLAALEPDELTLGSELDKSTSQYSGNWRDVASRLRGPRMSLGHKLNHNWDANPFHAWRIGRYLRELDFKAVSFYTSEPWALDPDWAIGEFGLGTTDESRPWYFQEDLLFRTEADFIARRNWYERFLRWLSGREGDRAACFWTTGQYDVLGLNYERWRDDGIVDLVRAYNSQASP